MVSILFPKNRIGRSRHNVHLKTADAKATPNDRLTREIHPFSPLTQPQNAPCILFPLVWWLQMPTHPKYTMETPLRARPRVYRSNRFEKTTFSGGLTHCWAGIVMSPGPAISGHAPASDRQLHIELTRPQRPAVQALESLLQRGNRAGNGRHSERGNNPP